MRSLLMIFSLIICSQFLLGQNRVTTYYPNKKTKEIYFTKSKSDTTKDGEYLLLTPEQSVKESGKYANGNRIGLWKTYQINGEYRDLVVYKDYNTNKTYKRFEYDMHGWYSPKYPKKAIENGVEGIVLLMVTSDSCKVKDYKVQKGLGYGCDEATLEAFKKYVNLKHSDNLKYKLDTCKEQKTIFEYRFKLL